MTGPCKHLGCSLAGMKSRECFGRDVVHAPTYVVWATPGHPTRGWAVGKEIRLGCLKVVAYVESRPLASMLAKRLTDGDY